MAMNELEKATQIYSEVGSAPVTYGPRTNPSDPSMPIINKQISTGGMEQASGAMDTWRYGSPADVRDAKFGGYSGGGAIAGGGYTPPAPQQKYKPVKFKAPDKLKLPEYKPPERDEGEERGFRREYMGPGMAQVRRSTQEAIISSKSFDNPNARALFIRDALKGVGEGVEKVAGGAQREARAEATRRYAEDVSNYIGKWNAKAAEKTANFDAEWKAALAEFGEKQFGAHAGYQMQSAGGGGGYGVFGGGGAEGVQPVSTGSKIMDIIQQNKLNRSF